MLKQVVGANRRPGMVHECHFEGGGAGHVVQAPALLGQGLGPDGEQGGFDDNLAADIAPELTAPN